MARARIVVPAEDPDVLFTRRTCREVIGRRFPIGDAFGRSRGEGIIVDAKLAQGAHALALVVDVPDHLAGTLQPDVGFSLDSPRSIDLQA